LVFGGKMLFEAAEKGVCPENAGDPPAKEENAGDPPAED
jgi:hypothetical protein